MGTHQELEMFGNQPAYPEKLLHKKESLQNQLINIRVELSQATTVPPQLRPHPDREPPLPGCAHQLLLSYAGRSSRVLLARRATNTRP